MSISPQSGARGLKRLWGKYGEGSRLYYIQLWPHTNLYCFFLNNKIYTFFLIYTYYSFLLGPPNVRQLKSIKLKNNYIFFFLFIYLFIYRRFFYYNG